MIRISLSLFTLACINFLIRKYGTIDYSIQFKYVFMTTFLHPLWFAPYFGEPSSIRKFHQPRFYRHSLLPSWVFFLISCTRFRQISFPLLFIDGLLIILKVLISHSLSLDYSSFVFCEHTLVVHEP